MAKQTKKQDVKFELTNFEPNQIVDFSKWEKQQKEIVKENPFIEVVDNETWEIGKQRRTTLRTARTSLEKERDSVKRELNNVKKFVADKYDGFIEITVPAEEKQQASVKAFEDQKEAEKARQAELDEQRLDGIRELIDECEGSLDKIILTMTHETIEDSQQKFDATVDSAQYDDDQLMELKFLFGEMVERQQEKFDERVKEVIENERQRVEALKVKQQSLINELYVQANQAIDVMTMDTIPQTTKKIDEIFDTDFDFGEFKEKFESVANQMFTKLERTVETMKKEHEQLAIRERENELNNQRNRIVEVREGLLDLVFQMNVDNHVEQKELINEKGKRPDGLFDELVPEWSKEIARVKNSLEQKMELINGQIEQRKFKAEQEQRAKDERLNTRIKQLMELGMERDESNGSFYLSGSNAEMDNLTKISEFNVENTGDDLWIEMLAKIEDVKAENKIHNRRWDIRKPELESLGLVEIDNDHGGEFIFEPDPQIGIHSGMVIGLNDEDFAERRDDIKESIQQWKENDAKEQERQKRIRHDKSNLTEWINHAVRIQTPERIDGLTSNDEMKEFHDGMIKELNAWCDAKIDEIKNF